MKNKPQRKSAAQQAAPEKEPAWTTGRIIRTGMMVVCVPLIAIVILGYFGYQMIYANVYYYLVALLVIGLLGLAILGVKKLAKRERSQRTMTICMSVISVLVVFYLMINISSYTATYNVKYATLKSPGGQSVVIIENPSINKEALDKYLAENQTTAAPEDASVQTTPGTAAEATEAATAVPATEAPAPEAAGAAVETTQAAGTDGTNEAFNDLKAADLLNSEYAAYPVRGLIFYDTNAKGEGSIITPYNSEVEIKVEWTEDGGRIYSETETAEGEIHIDVK